MKQDHFKFSNQSSTNSKFQIGEDWVHVILACPISYTFEELSAQNESQIAAIESEIAMEKQAGSLSRKLRTLTIELGERHAAFALVNSEDKWHEYRDVYHTKHSSLDALMTSDTTPQRLLMLTPDAPPSNDHTTEAHVMADLTPQKSFSGGAIMSPLANQSFTPKPELRGGPDKDILSLTKAMLDDKELSPNLQKL